MESAYKFLTVKWYSMRGPIACIFAASLVGIAILSLDIARLIAFDATVSRGSEQWSLTQMEVDLLALEAAILRARPGNDPAPDKIKMVRQKFDILYSRVMAVVETEAHLLLAKNSEVKKDFISIKNFVRKRAPLIDATDSSLLLTLHNMELEVTKLRTAVRAIALAGLKAAVQKTTESRGKAQQTLVFLAATTVILIVTLLAMIVALLRLGSINGKRRVESELMLAHMAAIVATSQDAVITIDEKKQITSFNASATQLFGHTTFDANKKNVVDFLVPLDQRALFTELIREVSSAPNGENAKRLRLLACKKDGSILPVEISISSTNDMDPKLLVAFFRDLTAEVQAEQSLLQARDKALAGERVKSDLLAIMSHEIRTPLNGLLGTIELLSKTSLSIKQREFLQILESSGEVLMHHVNDVLEVSRHDSMPVRVEAEMIDLSELAHSVMDNQAAFALQRGTELVLDIPDKHRCAVISDGRLLKQILLNLVGNAVKFTKNGTVKLRINQPNPEGAIDFAIEDTGIGISTANLTRIFEDFVTLDSSYSRNHSGTGLGLGITRRAVALLGGELCVISRLNEGSKFYFSLTLPPAQPVEIQALNIDCNMKPQDGRRLNILVIEDNAINRVVLHEMLSQLGHKITEAIDGVRGVAVASESHFDIVLMDISMPQLDGLQATARIRREGGPNHSTPIIAMTAHALPHEQENFRAAGMQGILLKPFSMRKLCCAIKSVHCHTDVACDTDFNIFAKLIPAFLLEGNSLVKEIVELADQENNIDTLKEKVHKFAGSAAVFGAVELSCKLKSTETNIKQGLIQEARSEISTLPCCWHRTNIQLSSKVTRCDPPCEGSLAVI